MFDLHASLVKGLMNLRCEPVGHGLKSKHLDFGTSWVGTSTPNDFRGGKEMKIFLQEC